MTVLRGVVFILVTVLMHGLCDSIVFLLMIRRPPRSTLDRSSAASDVYKRQELKKRKEFFYPPFSRIIHISFKHKIKEVVERAALVYADAMKIKYGQYIVGPAEPVSYTHLRAHETVLEFVCRLFLEKKKTKTTPVSW